MRTLSLPVLTTVLLLGASTAVLGETGDRTPAASYVTGVITESFGTPPEPAQADGVDRLEMLAERAIEWSDDRLPSRMLVRTLLDTREGQHPEGTVWSTVSALSYRLEGEEGVWVGTGQGLGAGPEGMPAESFGLMEAEWVTLAGEGAYEGLSAVLLLTVDVGDWLAGDYAYEGYIYEGTPPPFPDPLEPGFTLPE